jgi:hypothetical protein
MMSLCVHIRHNNRTGKVVSSVGFARQARAVQTSDCANKLQKFQISILNSLFFFFFLAYCLNLHCGPSKQNPHK